MISTRSINAPSFGGVLPIPTGGMIIGQRGIAEAYATGRGRIFVRGTVSQETIGKKDTLVINSIPYQVVQNALIEKIVDAARNGRIDGISDIKNLSDKNHRTRIVI